jgi:hypothetical protein
VQLRHGLGQGLHLDGLAAAAVNSEMFFKKNLSNYFSQVQQ